jgi:hypothetical protein
MTLKDKIVQLLLEEGVSMVQGNSDNIIATTYLDNDIVSREYIEYSSINQAISYALQQLHKGKGM